VENPKEFLELFISNDIFGILVNLLFSLSEDVKDEYQIVSDILSVLENFIEIYPFSSQLLCENTKLLNWLLKRIYREDDEVSFPNKLFASEILNSLIQASTENQILFTKRDGLNLTLQLVTQLPEPNGEEGEEFVHNLVNTICSCLLIPEHQKLFKDIDGIKSCIELMKSNNIFRHLAVKVLNYATQNSYKNCKELIEHDGLKSVFSYFMGKGFSKTKKYESLIESTEEHCLSIISSLCKFTKDIQFDRLIFKFKENKFEKCEKLVDFFTKYEKKANQKIENDDDEEKDEENFVEKLNLGLFNLQLVCTVLGFLLSSKFDDIKMKLNALFEKNGINVGRIRSILVDMAEHMGEEFMSTESFSNKAFINNIIKLI
jgi:beta-catenin-like protein 1